MQLKTRKVYPNISFCQSKKRVQKTENKYIFKVKFSYI
jgi:hypothetical protein